MSFESIEELEKIKNTFTATAHLTDYQKRMWENACFIDIKNQFEKAKLQQTEEILKIIEEMPCKGETHGFRPKWIDAEELKKQIEGKE